LAHRPRNQTDAAFVSDELNRDDGIRVVEVHAWLSTALLQCLDQRSVKLLLERLTMDLALVAADLSTPPISRRNS
jgi:hypothetical protein